MNIYWITPIIGVVFALLLGLFVLSKKIHSPLHQVFALFCLETFYWQLCWFISYFLHAPTTKDFIIRMAFSVIVFIPFTYYHFAILFLNLSPKKYHVKFGYLFASFFLILLWTSNVFLAGYRTFWWGYYPKVGSIFSFYLVGVFVYMIGALILMLKALRDENNKVGRNKIKYMTLAHFLYFFATIEYAIDYGIPWYPIGAFFIIGAWAVNAYAITKHRLMDISVIISRALAEIIAISIHAVVYLSVTWIYINYVSTTIDPLFIAFTIIYGVFVGQTHQQIRLFMQTAADKVFLHGKYDYYKSLAEASSRVCEQLSLEHILRVLYDTFHEVIEISNPKVFLPDNFSGAGKASAHYIVYDRETLKPKMNDQKVKVDDPLVKELINKREAIQNVKELDAALVVPCILEDRLIAFFALGRKLSEDAYTIEDIRLLHALGSQTAVELDHSRSYEKIKAELEAAIKELERSQRLAAIGTLTAGVTHEIRNPLTVIRAETERLPNQTRDQEYLKNFKELCLKHITRIEGIVMRMLKLAKEKPREEKDVDLNKEIEDVISFIKFDGIKLKKDLGPLSKIKGDPEEIEQVFVNLIQNAMEAMAHKGTLTVRSYRENNKNIVEISDTGKGIAPDIMESIFDPFYSTRHEGTGLGLSIAYRIIREHKGEIKVSSEMGKGTTFRVIF